MTTSQAKTVEARLPDRNVKLVLDHSLRCPSVMCYNGHHNAHDAAVTVTTMTTSLRQTG
jgi:hypothetical protein